MINKNNNLINQKIKVLPFGKGWNGLLIWIYLLCILTTSSIIAQQTPAPKQSEAVTILGATAHLGNGKVIQNSFIQFENGKLTVVDDARLTKKPIKGKVIKAQGKQLYPGFITMNSTLGLVEIDAVKATKDESELGEFNPNIRSIVAYNPESKITETVRANGVLIGQITPRGGRISGSSSVVQFDAWNYEDALLKADEGIHLNWPATFYTSGWWANGTSLKQNKKYAEQVTKISDFFDQTKLPDAEAINLKQRALSGLYNGTKTLYVHANNETEIIDAISFKNKNNIKKMVIVGGYEAYKLTDLLKKNNIAVVLKRIHSLPSSDDDAIKLPFKLAKILDDAGVLVALDTAGDMERMNSRNLPFNAGTAVAYGLDYEKAVAMLTANPAKIMGLNKQFGTIEVGKDATLILSTGDALDMRGNHIEKAFIQGRDINLDTHQKQLYRNFMKKYEQE
jgi:imidazolonepropionase-like amidohydrolase